MIHLTYNQVALIIHVSLLFIHNVLATKDFGRPLGVVQQNSTNVNASVEPYSPWLRRVRRPRATGCWYRPWICNQGQIPPKLNLRCCRDRCVDVFTDVNNCGLCGIRCPYNWQCCFGLCIDTNINPFHCGSCDHRCPFLSFCSYGMCGYAQPLPPFPFPPRPPKPPFPPKPPLPPLPPLPPFPFPPKPPKPPFPFPPKHPSPPPSFFPPKLPKTSDHSKPSKSHHHRHRHHPQKEHSLPPT